MCTDNMYGRHNVPTYIVIGTDGNGGTAEAVEPLEGVENVKEN